jgi:DivIVA domain-containing protein
VVTTALIYLVVMVLVAAVVFLLASVVFGRGEEMPGLPPGASPTRLPESGVTAEDLREVRFQQVVRGYKMSEVDWVLQQVGTELDELRARVDELEAALPEEPEPERDAADVADVGAPEPESEPVDDLDEDSELDDLSPELEPEPEHKSR